MDKKTKGFSKHQFSPPPSISELGRQGVPLKLDKTIQRIDLCFQWIRIATLKWGGRGANVGCKSALWIFCPSTVWASICNLRNVWPAALQPASQTTVDSKISCRVMCSSVAHSINQLVIMRPEPTLCFGLPPGAAHNFCICLH